MNYNLKELYSDIVKRNEEDYNELLNYYYELLKKNYCSKYIGGIYDINNIMKEQYDELNIFNFWFCLEKLFNGDRNLTWIEHPLVFSFKNDLSCIEDDLTHKARIINSDFRKYYLNSKYFKELKNIIKDLLNTNKLGLTKKEILDNIDLDINSKEFDISKALEDLLNNNDINIIEGKKPTTYYII